MGADLIGYTLVRPAKGSEKIASAQVKKLQTIIKNKKLTDEAKVVQLIDQGTDLANSQDIEEMSATDYLARINEKISLYESNSNLQGRDVNSRFARVGKKDIEIIFAGQMSWGDEPDGYGYQTLQACVELGISEAWEKALSSKKGA